MTFTCTSTSPITLPISASLYVYDEDDSYDDILDYNDNPDYTSMSWQRNVYRGFSMNIEESSTDYKPVSLTSRFLLLTAD